MHQRLHQIFLDHLGQHFHLRGDGGVRLSVQIAEQEGPARFLGQTVEGAANLVQRLDGGKDLLRGRIALLRLGDLGEFGEIGLLDALAPCPVDDQAIGGCRQVGAGLPQPRQFAGTKDAQKGIVCQVGSTVRTAQASTQTLHQPAMVVGIEGVKLVLEGRVNGRHARRILFSRTAGRLRHVVAACACRPARAQVLPVYVPSGSVTKPILTSPALAAAAITCATFS